MEVKLRDCGPLSFAQLPIVPDSDSESHAAFVGSPGREEPDDENK